MEKENLPNQEVEIPIGLNEFLFSANENGYAGEGKEVEPQRPKFKEIEYIEGDWYFRDSYSGFYFAPGQEVVYFKDKPIWAMAYAGGMKFDYHGDHDFAKQTFSFLKRALMAMDKEKPFRGPENFEEGEWKYESKVEGDIRDFLGNEKIYYQGELVFEQNFIGGLIVSK
jgi:hypothetical protein